VFNHRIHFRSHEDGGPQSRRRGRPGTPAEVIIRMLILKHLFDWSYDDLEQEVRANLVYRAFTRIDAGEVPDAKTILKIARARGPDVIEQLHRQVVEVAKRAGVTHGRTPSHGGPLMSNQRAVPSEDRIGCDERGHLA
jgi:hypothetical protein